MTDRLDPETTAAALTGCPDERELLQLLDGELPPARAAAVQAHLRACWTCRAQYEDAKATVSAFVDLMHGPVRERMPAPPRRWSGFDARLRAMAASYPAVGAKGLARASVLRLLLFGVSWPRVRAWLANACAWLGEAAASLAGRRVMTAGALTLLVALFVASYPASPRLSAQVILDNVATADAHRLDGVSRPVMRQRFEARRRVNGLVVERAQWVLYYDVRSGRLREPGLPPLAREIGRVLDENQWDRRQPLAAASYNRWRSAAGAATPDVTALTLEDGRAGFRVRVRAGGPVATGGITAAGLIVRAEDWHPIGQELEVRTATGSADFQIAELAFDVLRFDRVASEIFDEPAPASRAASAASAPAPSDADLDASEMLARFVLHEHGADRGEPIQVLRSRNRVTVRGLVDTTARTTELASALSEVAYVQVDLTTVAVAAGRATAAGGARAKRPSSGAGPSVSNATDAGGDAAGGAASDAAGREPTVLHPDRGGDPPLQALIDSYLASSASGGPPADGRGVAQRRNAFVTTTLAAADQAMAEAWALRRLADRYPSDVLTRATDRSRGLLEQMVRDHVRALVSSTTTWRAALDGLAPFARARLGAEASASSAAPGSSAAPASGAASGASASAVTTAGASTASGERSSAAAEPWPAYASTVFRELVRAQSLTADGLMGGAALSSERAAGARAPERQLLDLLDGLTAIERVLRQLDAHAAAGHRLTGAREPAHD